MLCSGDMHCCKQHRTYLHGPCIFNVYGAAKCLGMGAWEQHGGQTTCLEK